MREDELMALHQLAFQISQLVERIDYPQSYMKEYMNTLELNTLAQICSNQQLSEETRAIAATRLEYAIREAYPYIQPNIQQKPQK